MGRLWHTPTQQSQPPGRSNANERAERFTHQVGLAHPRISKFYGLPIQRVFNRNCQAHGSPS